MIHAELADRGIHVGRERVARLMKAAGLQGVSRRKITWSIRRSVDSRPAPDLVERDFTADGPNRLWVDDITYPSTWAGLLYLAVVLDVWSCRVVGWSMESHLRTELLMDAFNMAAQQRRSGMSSTTPAWVVSTFPSPMASVVRSWVFVHQWN